MKDEIESIKGTRQLTATDIFFEDEIVDAGDGTVNFYLSIYFDPTEIFGEKADIGPCEGYVNAYVNFDMDKDDVVDDVEVYCVYDGKDGRQDEERIYHYRLSPEEKAILRKKMFAYQGGVLSEMIHQYRQSN